MTPGTELGRYKIHSLLGKGGMGEVWRARDTTLDRDVAIKLLPDNLAGDSDRLARFDREAKILASLNHANIATIHGFEEVDGRRFIVLELIEGRTLAEVLESGPLPVQQALDFAVQIAEALESAHARGIVHRDLKPANVEVTEEDLVKVLDFGLARPLMAPASPGSPGTTQTALTRDAALRGTPAYMSPEQVRGEQADAQTDIWAFGCVLFEMLTGQPAFTGGTVSDIMAGVLRSDPDWAALPHDLSPRVLELLERSIERKRKDRYHSVADIRVELRRIIDGIGDGVVPPGAPVRARPRVWPVAAALLVGAGIALFADARFRPAEDVPEPRPVHAYTVAIDASDALPDATFPLLGSELAVSPDETQLVVAIMDAAGESRLARYTFADRRFDWIDGTNGASTPFFSPDGGQLGFVRDGQIYKIPAQTGGTPTRLAPGIETSAERVGAAWTSEGIVTAPAALASGLVLIPETGGAPRQLTEGNYRNVFPQWLPQGHSVLFTAYDGVTSYDQARLELVSIESGSRQVLVEGGSFGRYLDGYLVYVKGGVLFTAPFDPARPEGFDSETARPLPFDAEYNAGTGRASIAFGARTGLAVLREGSSAKDALLRTELTYLYEDGRRMPIPGIARAVDAYRWIRFSPGGDYLAVKVDRALWIYDVARQTFFALVDDVAVSGYDWVDRDRIVYVDADSGQYLLIDMRGETVAVLMDPVESPVPMNSAGDGRIFRNDPARGLMFADLAVDPAPSIGPWSLFPSEPGDLFAALAPDARFLAYCDCIPRPTIKVAAFPTGGVQTLGDGGNAVWSRTDERLFIATNTATEDGVNLSYFDYTIADGQIRFEAQRPWADGTILAHPELGAVLYAYSPDPNHPERLAALLPTRLASASAPGELTVVENFADAIRRVFGE